MTWRGILRGNSCHRKQHSYTLTSPHHDDDDHGDQDDGDGDDDERREEGLFGGN